MNEILTKTGLAYVRVSTDKQEELSPDAQVRLIKEYAAKNNILLTEIFIENGISGRKAEKRPEFMRMIATAKEEANGIHTILVWKFSRFARNQEESIVYKSLLKKQHNIDVISVSEPLIDGPFGSLIERIIEWMDEYYSIRLSGEVFRGMTEKAMRGGYQAKPPFGYRMEKGGVPKIHPEEANAVKNIFMKYTNENMSTTDIARWMNDSGFHTLRGNLFDSRCIRYMLENPFYTGKMRWNYSSRERVLKDEEEWIIVEGQHEPIIDRELYELTQTSLKKRLRPYRQRSVSTCKHWLSGMLVCSSCGRTLGFNSAKGSNGYAMSFQCWGYGKGLCKHSHALSERRAVAAVISGLEKYLESDSFTYTVVQNQCEPTADPSIKIKEKLASTLKKMDRIKESYRNGIDTIEEYRVNKELLLREQEMLNQELSNIMKPVPRDTVQEKKIAITSVSDVLAVLSDEKADYIKKGNAIRAVCKKITYDKENNHMDFDIVITL